MPAAVLAVNLLVGAGGYFYFAINAVNIIKMQANTSIGPLQVAIGVITILVTIELCRRCVGIPILCVGGQYCFLFFFHVFHVDAFRCG